MKASAVNNVIVILEKGRDARMFRECHAVIAQRNARGEPSTIRVLDEDESFVGGDRVELVKILVPEECFTKP